MGRWAWMLLGVVAARILAGCVSAETIAKREKEAEGYYQQGLAVLESDQQRAFISFQKAVQTNPTNYDAHYALGHIYFLRKEFADAEREFRACLDLNPNSGEAMNYLGRTLVFLARAPEAIELFRKAATFPLYATPDIAFFHLGGALHMQGDIPGAIRAYQDALKIEPPNVPRALVYLELGRLHMLQGEDGKAREALAQAKTLDPEGTAGAEATRMMKRLR